VASIVTSRPNWRRVKGATCKHTFPALGSRFRIKSIRFFRREIIIIVKAIYVYLIVFLIFCHPNI
jgi:hypothetical protein